MLIGRGMEKKKSCDLIWQMPICVVYCIYKIKKDDNENAELRAYDGKWLTPTIMIMKIPN
jgi:hypothetical protein